MAWTILRSSVVDKIFHTLKEIQDEMATTRQQLDDLLAQEKTALDSLSTSAADLATSAAAIITALNNAGVLPDFAVEAQSVSDNLAAIAADQKTVSDAKAAIDAALNPPPPAP